MSNITRERPRTLEDGVSILIFDYERVLELPASTPTVAPVTGLVLTFGTYPCFAKRRAAESILIGKILLLHSPTRQKKNPSAPPGLNYSESCYEKGLAPTRRAPNKNPLSARVQRQENVSHKKWVLGTCR